MTILDRGANAVAVLAALSKPQAMIECDMSGKIPTANDKFCKALGFEFFEVIGKHPSLSIDLTFASSPTSKAFWTNRKATTGSRPSQTGWQASVRKLVAR